MRILGIETSCDETGVAIFDSKLGLIGHDLFSQIAIHAQYGGVVPELASRDHILKLLPMVKKLLQQTNSTKEQLDGIAYTAGPGLMGALLAGASFARSLGWAWNIPTIGIHHMEGHLLAPMLEENKPTYPFIALLVSGGHTQLFKIDAIGQYQLLGESVDDAAGEAFDKVAKMLGLSYPGGPLIATLAEHGNPARFTFPRPMLNRPGLDFSFSGLKTHVLHTINKITKNNSIDQQSKADIAYAFQAAVVDTLVKKCDRALQLTGLTQLVIAGGVSANQLLRETLATMTQQKNAQLFYPRMEFCTDNGAMIAYAGYHRLNAGQTDNLAIIARPRWSMEDLPPLT